MRLNPVRPEPLLSLSLSGQKEVCASRPVYLGLISNGHNTSIEVVVYRTLPSPDIETSPIRVHMDWSRALPSNRAHDISSDYTIFSMNTPNPTPTMPLITNTLLTEVEPQARKISLAHAYGKNPSKREAKSSYPNYLCQDDKM